jgi:hypothetical protein
MINEDDGLGAAETLMPCYDVTRLACFGLSNAALVF